MTVSSFFIGSFPVSIQLTPPVFFPSMYLVKDNIEQTRRQYTVVFNVLTYLNKEESRSILQDT